MEKYPIYKASVALDGTGMYVVSLVEEPAVDSYFLAFSKEVKPLEFAIENEEQHIIKGVVMRCDYPILRQNEAGQYYYLVFDKDTIEMMAQKFFKDNNQENVDIQHSFNLIEGIELQQMFMSDKEHGINPQGFENIEDHSLFAVYKVTDEALWDKVKTGEWGFSLAGRFELNEEDPEEKEVWDLIKQLEALLK